MEYRKLVRDNIPHIIRRQGRVPHTRILPAHQRALALADKLVEEALEYRAAIAQGQDASAQAEELADVMEVLRAALGRDGAGHRQVAAARAAKHALRGGFEKWVYLEAVTEAE